MNSVLVEVIVEGDDGVCEITRSFRPVRSCGEVPFAGKVFVFVRALILIILPEYLAAHECAIQKAHSYLPPISS